MRAEDFAGKEPILRLEDYFPGRSKATGIFQDRFGKVRQQFEAVIDADWDGTTLSLAEEFVYDTGKVEHRQWRITPVGEHGYEGRCDDVPGVAKGAAYGNAFHWTYGFLIARQNRTCRVHFDDWLFLRGDGILINRAKVRKFGLLLGETTLVFHKA